MGIYPKPKVSKKASKVADLSNAGGPQIGDSELLSASYETIDSAIYLEIRKPE